MKNTLHTTANGNGAAASHNGSPRQVSFAPEPLGLRTNINEDTSKEEKQAPSSPRNTHHMAILLPVTSRHSDLWIHLTEFLSTFQRTVSASPPPSSRLPKENETWKFSFFVGLPDVDDRGQPQESSSKVQKIRKMFDDTMVKANNNPNGNEFAVHLHFLRTGKDPRASAMWHDLATIARTKTGSDCEFFAFLRDDVRFKSDLWQDAVLKGFKDIQASRKQPFGFGCVAFLDESFPAFPSFPVLHRTHFDIFGNDSVFACEFKQRDADAFLFEIYFRYKCAKILPSARLVRQPMLRTEQEAKKRTIQITNLLPAALDKCQAWLAKHGSKSPAPLLGFDIIVPSFRATKDVLERILHLPTPDNFACRFIIVCDNPDSKTALKVFQDLESDHEHDAGVRIRMNAANVGPGGTRNHGLAEATGDYVLFLDDDVLPEPNIIQEYGHLIDKYPHAAGFIGRTVLPPPKTPRQFAIGYAGIAYFWDIASKTSRDLPWGITANLCIKRSKDVWFHTDVFPKGGGGEDVDLCLRLDKHYRERFKDARSFVPAPKATVHHPYWNNGDCFMHHFFGWTKGDSKLMEVYPEKSFLSLPDFSETMAILTVASIALLAMEMITWPTVLVTLLAYVAAEIAYETICHLDLVREWGLPFTIRVGAMTCVLRTYADIGRFYGQFERGTLLHRAFRRYNWFEDNWPEYPSVERRRAFKRGLFRLTTVATTLYLTHHFVQRSLEDAESGLGCAATV